MRKSRFSPAINTPVSHLTIATCHPSFDSTGHAEGHGKNSLENRLGSQIWSFMSLLRDRRVFSPLSWARVTARGGEFRGVRGHVRRHSGAPGARILPLPLLGCLWPGPLRSHFLNLLQERPELTLPTELTAALLPPLWSGVRPDTSASSWEVSTNTHKHLSWVLTHVILDPSGCGIAQFLLLKSLIFWVPGSHFLAILPPFVPPPHPPPPSPNLPVPLKAAKDISGLPTYP